MRPNRSLWLPMFVIPAGLMLLLAAYTAGNTTLNCWRVEATQANCTVSSQRWLGLVDVGRQSITNLKYARIETYDCDVTNSNGDRRQETCRKLVLDTGTGPAYFDLLIESSDKINNFLADSTRPALTVQNNQWTFSVAVGAFALAWLGFGWFARRQLAKSRVRYSQARARRQTNGRS